MRTYLKQAENRPEHRRDVEKTVRDMLAEISERGDKAVRDFALRLDGWKDQDFQVPSPVLGFIVRQNLQYTVFQNPLQRKLSPLAFMSLSYLPAISAPASLKRLPLVCLKTRYKNIRM